MKVTRHLALLLMCFVVLAIPSFALETSTDSTLTDISSTIAWQDGAFAISGGIYLPSTNNKEIRATISNPEKQTIYFEAGTAYEFKVIEAVASGTGYSAKRKYSTAHSVEFDKWMNSGYYHVYPDRIYLIELRNTDGAVVSAANVNSYIRLYKVDNANHIPKYYEQHIADKAASINKIQAKNDKTSSFIWITDMHMQHNAKHSPALIRYLRDNCGINQVVGGGDFVTAWLSDADGKEGLLDDMREADALYKDIPLIKTPGNHEWAFGGKNQYGLTEAEMYEYWYKKDIENTGAVKNDNGDPTTYYYLDDTTNKIRYINLNVMDYEVDLGDDGLVAGGVQNPKTYDYKMSAEQVAWLKDTALVVPDNEYGVVIFTHIAVWDTNERPGADDLVGYRMEAREVIEGYMNKTGDYANYKGEFIGWFSGHSHYDHMLNISNFAQVVSNGDGTPVTSGMPNRPLNTVAEQCFDVVTIDKVNRQVYLTRIGAGEDRSFVY